MSAKITERRLLAAAVEVTEGTAVTLNASNAAFLVMDVKAESTIQITKRKIAGYVDDAVSVPGSQMGKISWTQEMTGANASNWASLFLPACAWLPSQGTYSANTFSPVHPDSSNVTSLTIAVYEGGVASEIAGARGDWEIDWESGKPQRIKFTFEGKWISQTDTANPNPTFPTTVPAPFLGGTVTAGAFSPMLAKINIKANNKLYVRVNELDATGFSSCSITSREPSLNMDPEQTSVATQDWVGQVVAGSTVAFSAAVGPAGNRITVTGPALQYEKSARGDRSGVMTAEVEGGFKGVGGNDSLMITLS